MCARISRVLRTQFHDHAIAITRQNVFAGLAGFYLLRPAGGASYALDALFPGVYDFPLALQDRSFKQHLAADGLMEEVCLCYGAATGENGLRLGTWEPEWAGRVAVVNGKVWPVLAVAARPYRFRLLAGANARTWNLKLKAVGGADVATCDEALSWYQIGTEGGLYSASRCAHHACACACVAICCALTPGSACAPGPLLAATSWRAASSWFPRSARRSLSTSATLPSAACTR
jgi:spore coat protein A